MPELSHAAAGCEVGAVGFFTSLLKALFPEFKALEHRVELIIAEKFGFDTITDDCRKLIKQCDLSVLALEKSKLMPKSEEPWAILSGIEPATVHLGWMGPEEAFTAFHFRANEILCALNVCAC